MDCLEIISEWPDKDSSSGANQLLNSVKQPQFLISLHVAAKVFAVSLGLCRSLQKENLDLAEAINLADDVLRVIGDMRSNADTVFGDLFASVSQLAADIDVELVQPRLTKRQINRCNVVAESDEAYFRIAIFVPFIESFCGHLTDRLLMHRNVLSDFMCLLPCNGSTAPNSGQATAMKRLCENYAVDLEYGCDVAVAEQQVWYRQLASMQQSPRNAAEAYELCCEDAFPCIKKLLQIMTTLPVTTCSSERSFSTLRRLKTYLRSTMGSDRLNGLALLNIHRDVRVDAGCILDKLAEKPRRLQFRLQ